MSMHRVSSLVRPDHLLEDNGRSTSSPAWRGPPIHPSPKMVWTRSRGHGKMRLSDSMDPKRATTQHTPPSITKVSSAGLYVPNGSPTMTISASAPALSRVQQARPTALHVANSNSEVDVEMLRHLAGSSSPNSICSKIARLVPGLAEDDRIGLMQDARRQSASPLLPILQSRQDQARGGPTAPFLYEIQDVSLNRRASGAGMGGRRRRSNGRALGALLQAQSQREAEAGEETPPVLGRAVTGSCSPALPSPGPHARDRHAGAHTPFPGMQTHALVSLPRSRSERSTQCPSPTKQRASIASAKKRGEASFARVRADASAMHASETSDMNEFRDELLRLRNSLPKERPATSAKSLKPRTESAAHPMRNRSKATDLSDGIVKDDASLQGSSTGRLLLQRHGVFSPELDRALRRFHALARKWPKYREKQLLELYETYQYEQGLRASSRVGESAERQQSIEKLCAGAPTVEFDFLLRAYFPQASKGELAKMTQAVALIDAAEEALETRSLRRRQIARLFNTYAHGRDSLALGEFKSLIESVPGAFHADVNVDADKYRRQMQRIFRAFDADGNGLIDLSEFTQTIEEFDLFSSTLDSAQEQATLRIAKRPSLLDIAATLSPVAATKAQE